MTKRHTRKRKMDENTQEIMRDRIRYQIKQGREFSDFLGTIEWKQEAWIDKYNDSEEAIKDLLDLWYEVKEEN